MGQALRRATGRLPSPSSSIHRSPPVEPVSNRTTAGPTKTRAPATDGQDHLGISNPESVKSKNLRRERGLEQRREKTVAPSPLAAQSLDKGGRQLANLDTTVVNYNKENIPKTANEHGVIEERDPGYDAMLSKMVGRIKTKPGGKLEMGEAFIVEKYNRPLPKLRSSSKAEVRDDGQKPAHPGTVTAAQLQEIILLHQGKSEQHQGPMSIPDIAEKFRIDAARVEKIVRFISMPPENNTKNTKQ